MTNKEVRAALFQTGVKQWELAEETGFSEAYFSRKLRRELPDEEQKKLIDMVYAIARKKQEG